MNGTDKSDIGLPTNVGVTLDDGTTQNIDVEWDDGDPTFDKFVARNYVFTGTLDLPSGVVNTNNFDVSVTVKVGDPYITEITDIANIGVINGTEMSDIGLPTKVEVTLNDGNKQNIDVNWDNGDTDYDKSVAVNYVFTGTVDIATGVVNRNNVKASVTVTVGNPYITEITDIANIGVINGTEMSDIGLPTKVEVTLNDGNKQNIDVNWDNGNPNYDKSVAGNYVFTGTLDLPTGVVNTNNVEASVTVTVGDLYITDVDAIANITVTNGTDKSDIGLPEDIEITLNDGSTQNVDVNWDNGDPSYNKFVARNYVFTGTLDLLTGVVNTNNVEASVTVTVGDLYITDVDAIANIDVTNGTDKSDIGLPEEIGITLNDGSTQNIDVNWDNGDPAYNKFVSGNYVFTGTLDLLTGVVNTNNVKASVTVTVGDLYVTDVDAIANIDVTNGTDKSDIGLPKDIGITLNDGSTQNIDVNWDNGDPAYNKFVSGNYVFTGTLDLPTGIVNTNDIKASVIVKVGALYVTDIANIADITVANGTDKSDIGLPINVGVTLNDGNTQNIDVNWDNGDPAYAQSIAGEYVFTGTLDLPSGVVNTKDIKVTVTVAPKTLIVPLNTKTEVFAGQVGTIEGTNTQIMFPQDLPSGTFVTITNVSGESFVTNAEGIERSGDVLDFKFEYPSGQSFTGSFELTMSYGNGFATEIDIYYYNENDAKWEAQNGTMDTNNNIITINPDHFSIYGVFALKEADEPGDADSKGNGGSEGSSANGDDGNDKTTVIVDGGSDVQDTKGTGDKVLPKTATNTFNMMAVGLILLVLGGISFVFIRRRALKQ